MNCGIWGWGVYLHFSLSLDRANDWPIHQLNFRQFYVRIYVNWCVPFQQLRLLLQCANDTRTFSDLFSFELNCPPFEQRWRYAFYNSSMCDVAWAGMATTSISHHHAQSTKCQWNLWSKQIKWDEIEMSMRMWMFAWQLLPPLHCCRLGWVCGVRCLFVAATQCETAE